MDFLDTSFASVNRAQYNDFLGLGNNKEKATASNAYEQDLLNRYPFTMDCAVMTKMVTDMYTESAQTLNARNSARQGNGRNDLTGKLRAFDAYIPAAVDFMKTVACAVPAPPSEASAGQNTSSGTTAGDDKVVNSIPVTTGSQLSATITGGSKLPMSNTLKYSLIGLGALVVVVIGIAIIKRN